MKSVFIELWREVGKGIRTAEKQKGNGNKEEQQEKGGKERER